MTLSDGIYRLQPRREVRDHVITFPALESFSRQVTELDRLLSSDDETARGFIGQLKAVRFFVAATPLAPADLAALFPRRFGLAAVSAPSRTVGIAYPSYRAVIDGVMQSLVELLDIEESPVEGELASIAMTYDIESLLVVLRGQSLVRACDLAVGRAILPPHTYRFVVADLLRGSAAMQHAAAVGPIGWFPLSVVSAPRAEAVHFVRCHWINAGTPNSAEWRLPGAKGELPALRLSTVVGSSPVAADLVTLSDSPSMEPVDLLPDRGSLREVRVPVKAVRISVEGGVVHVPIDGGQKAMVFDVLPGIEPRLRRESASNLEAGQYIVVRTEESGDYVATVADSLLGEKAAKLRETKQTWKFALRTLIKERGIWQVAVLLERSGSVRANTENIRRWAYGATIRPEATADLSAIVKVAELAAGVDAMLADLNELIRAHIHAGQSIRKQLEANLLASNMVELQRTGRLELRIPGGGALVALRIDEIDTTAVEVDEEDALVFIEERF
jgi:hypothetical protein